MIKKILASLLAIALVLVAYAYWYANSLEPKYTGEVQLPGLSAQAEIYFDDYGIPHIYAENEADAYRALGYVHAQDRLWQMEVVRRIAPGRLSEIFGSKLLKVDKLFRALGIQQYSEQMKGRIRSQWRSKN